MCGITGLIATKKEASLASLEQIVQAMRQKIAHRGPDSAGSWVDERAGVAFGHARLAIVDLSPEGRQPMISPSGRLVMVYNGEIYNFLSLRQELEGVGLKFRGRSDTEVMLAAIDQWGLNRTCQKIGGMFSIALYDRVSQEVHFVRDRLGKKPLYFGWAGSHLVFASELKALSAHPHFKPQLHHEALQAYYNYGAVPAPHTIYKNIWSVLPGARVSLVLERLKVGENLLPYMTPYWQASTVIQDARAQGIDAALSDQEVVSDFENRLVKNVTERMISDVPLGAFLSGGIDSSTVVALMQSQSRMPIQTFSIGFEEKGYDESGYARKIANHLGTQHHDQIITSKSAGEIVAKLPDMYDEPCSDASQIPTYLVSVLARQHVTVALSGDGGDEMLGGYRRHMFLQKYSAFARFLPLQLRKAFAMLIVKIPHIIRHNNAAKVRTLAHILCQSDDQAAHCAFLSQWVSQSPLRTQTNFLHFPLIDQSQWPVGLSGGQAGMFGDLIHYLPNDVLVKVDRASMAVGLEVRSPLLDYKLCEYLWRLPMRYKIRNGQGKWLLRQVLSNYVPSSLFDRPKQGFSVPVAQWLRGDLRDWAQSYLNEDALKQSGLYDVKALQRIWAEHLSGVHDHQALLWPVLMAECWRERWKPGL